MIPKQYSDHKKDPERLFIKELSDWIMTQPQDTWLLFVRTMNWDFFDDVADRMIAEPNCDIAIITRLFWSDSATYHMTRPGFDKTRCGRIVANLRKGWYRQSSFAFHRHEILGEARAYADALASLPKSTVAVPRILFGPHEGRLPMMPPLDAQTARDLEEIERELGYTVPRDMRATARSDAFMANWMKLPPVPSRPWTVLSDLSEAAYVNRLFGTRQDYEKAQSRAIAKGVRDRRWRVWNAATTSQKLYRSAVLALLGVGVAGLIGSLAVEVLG